MIGFPLVVIRFAKSAALWQAERATMRKLITVSMLAALAAGSGCRKSESAEMASTSVSSDVLAGYHFVGTASLASNSNASRLREVRALPETRKLEEQTLQKLAHAPKVFFGDKITTQQDERGAALLRPLLDDLIRSESFLQLRGPAIQQAEWMLMAQLPPDRLKAWSAALSELTRLWNLGSPTASSIEGFAASEVKRGAAPNLLRWLEAGQWFVLGVGQDNLPGVAAAARQIKATGRPIPVMSTNWLETELNLPRLSAALELSSAIEWPQAKLMIVGDGENLRSRMQMVFQEPVTGPLDPWQIPTNIIHEPLISFTAARGISPWLKNCATLDQLELTPAPNEVFFWAQGHVTFQSFVAFPLKDAAGKVERAARHAPSLFNTDWRKRGLAQIEWQTNTHELSWRLPYAVPFLKSAASKGRELVVGGLFPPSPLTNPPPAELISQVNNQPKLICYDWEITQARLASWRVIFQLYALVSGKSQFSTNNAALPWFLAAEPKLGNTATEIAANSPSEWSLTRKSHIGFTGVELVALALWLESTNFPKLSFELPANRPAQTVSMLPSPPANEATKP
jgi:hypothetical protein